MTVRLLRASTRVPAGAIGTVVDSCGDVLAALFPEHDTLLGLRAGDWEEVAM